MPNTVPTDYLVIFILGFTLGIVLAYRLTTGGQVSRTTLFRNADQK